MPAHAHARMEPADHEPVGEVLSTRTQRIWLRRDGIVQTANYDSQQGEGGGIVPIDLACAKENVAAVIAVSAGKRRPVYVDQQVSLPLTSEAQQHYASDEMARATTAVGILADSWIGRLLGNFVLRYKKGGVPTRLFQTEAEAVHWLKGYLQP
ncbi:MAG TPA: hypothetical protein VND93_04790 [Myxococcales bacterium]|nr:hypothetical protein [Myxococcales bacterium]